MQNNACVLRYTRGDGKFVYKTPRIEQVYRRIRIIRYTKFMQIRVPRNVYHKTIALLFMNVLVVVVFVVFVYLNITHIPTLQSLQRLFISDIL